MTHTSWLQEYIDQHQDDPSFLTARVVVALNRQIFERMEELGMSQKDLAKKADIPPAYLSRQLNHGKNLTIRTLVRLAHALETRIDGLELKPIAQAWHTTTGRLPKAPQEISGYSIIQNDLLSLPFPSDLKTNSQLHDDGNNLAA